MKKMRMLAFGFVLLGGITGCGGPASAGKDQIEAVNEMTAILDGIKDDKSADEALPKLEKTAAKAREAAEKIAAAKSPMSSDEMTKYTNALSDARTKMTASLTKATQAAPGKAERLVEAIGKAQPNIKMP